MDYTIIESENFTLILCLNTQNILSYIEKIKIKSNDVIIDQLFLTGNEANRFIKCKVINDKIDVSSTKIILPSNEIREASKEFLLNNYKYVTNSILSIDEFLKI